MQTQTPELYGSRHWSGMGSVFSRTKFAQISTSKEKHKNKFDAELSDLREDLRIPPGVNMLILAGSGSLKNLYRNLGGG